MLNECPPLKGLDLESLLGNYPCYGDDCFDISDVKMVKRKELSRILTLEKVRRPSQVTTTTTKECSKISHDHCFLGNDIEGSTTIENVPSPRPTEVCTSCSSESFDADHQLDSLGTQSRLEFLFEKEIFGDENKRPTFGNSTMWVNGGERNCDKNNEAKQVQAKKMNGFESTYPASLPMTCTYPQFGGVDDVVSSTATYLPCSSYCYNKTSSSPGKLDRSSNFKDGVQIKDLSPRMLRKLENLNSFRSKSLGGMLGKQLRNYAITMDQDDGQSSCGASKEDVEFVSGTCNFPISVECSLQQFKSNHRSRNQSQPSGSDAIFQTRSVRLHRRSTIHYIHTVSRANRDDDDSLPEALRDLAQAISSRTSNPGLFKEHSFRQTHTRELECDMEGRGEKKSRDIDRITKTQAPKIFSNSEKNLFHGGGGHEPKHTLSALTTRVEVELIRDMKLMKYLQVQRLAVAKFNIDPEECMNYLKSQGLLRENCPEDMCNFILSEPGLSKRKLGEMYGKDAQFEKDVFEHSLKSLNLQGLTLDNALRCMVRKFRMPGEAQQIDRIMGMFAKRFMEENQGTFSCTDTAYILSFSLMMLNTDLYNHNVKDAQKMTLEQFINNNKGIDQQGDLPRELLEGYYQRVQADEVRMDEWDMYESAVLTLIAPKRSGWLKKKKRKATIYSCWNKHWFALADGVLYYFIEPWDEAPRCIIQLEKCRVSKYLTKKDFSISRCDPNHVVTSVKILDDGSMVHGSRKEFILRADTEVDRDQWVQCIEEEIHSRE